MGRLLPLHFQLEPQFNFVAEKNLVPIYIYIYVYKGDEEMMKRESPSLWITRFLNYNSNSILYLQDVRTSSPRLQHYRIKVKLKV